VTFQPSYKQHLKFKSFDTLSGIESTWDAILPEGHQLCSGELLLLEKVNSNDLTFRYVIFYDDDLEKAAGVAYFQVINFSKKHYRAPLFENRLAKGVENLLMRKGYKIFICGNLFRIDYPGIYFQEHKTSASEIMASLENFIGHANPSPAAVLIKDWKDTWSKEWVTKYLYKGWPDDLTMKLNLQPSWNSFQDYTDSLKHKYAQRVRKARSRFGEVVRQELSLGEISVHGNKLNELYQQVVQRQMIRMVILNPEYFIQMKKHYKDDFKLFAYFTDGKLIAFTTNILYDHQWELHYIGMDYKYNDQMWLYFNLLYDAIGDAISAGKKELELGRTARQAKTMLGAQPVYFSSFYKLKGTIVNRLVNFFAERFNTEMESAVERHPFKTSKISYVSDPEMQLNPSIQLPGEHG
jgi:hypothetical protein